MKITKEGWAVVERDSHFGHWVEAHRKLDFDFNFQGAVLPHIHKGYTILDIGANIGSYTYAFNKVEDVTIYAFEPNPEVFECLVHNLQKFDNIHLCNVAVGAKEGKVNVITPNDNIGMGYVEEGSEIQLVTIDHFYSDYSINKCDFIKIDVEGYELEVLMGAEKTIDKYSPTLVIEINNATLERKGITRKDIFDFLDKKGYTYTNIYPWENMMGQQLDIIAYR